MIYIPVYHSKSDIHGIGVFTPVSIKKGQIIGVSHAYYSDYWYMTTHGYYNHSKNPNCIIEKNNNICLIIANKDIRERKELTVDYTKQLYLEQPKKDWK